MKIADTLTTHSNKTTAMFVMFILFKYTQTYAQRIAHTTQTYIENENIWIVTLYFD